MACGASVWNPCAATGEAAGMAAAVIARRAAAASAALWRVWNEVRNAWTGRARILKRLTSGEPELCAFAPAKSTFRKGLPLDSLKGDEALRLHVLEGIRLREPRPRRLRRRVVQPGENGARRRDRRQRRDRHRHAGVRDRAEVEGPLRRQRHAGGDAALGLRRDGGDLGPARAGAVGRLGRGARRKAKSCGRAGAAAGWSSSAANMLREPPGNGAGLPSVRKVARSLRSSEPRVEARPT